MDPPTPQNNRITNLLQGLNNGLTFLSGKRGPAVEEDSSDDDIGAASSSVVANDVVANDVEDKQNSATKLPPNNQNNQVNINNDVVGNVISPSTMPKKKKSRKSKNLINDPDENVVADPPRKRVANPSEMEAAYEEGYDTDGWEGPPQGTNEDELEDVEEAAIQATSPPPPTTTTTQTSAENFTPVHVPILEDKLRKLTVAKLKHELLIRGVPAPKSAKKPLLLQKLTEALKQQLPVYPKNKETLQRAKDDMSHFGVGAYWEQLEADIDVDEPVHANFPTARAPTVPLEDVGIQPRPKQSFSSTFDRPMFTGRTGQNEFRAKGVPKPSFLKKHQLNKDSLPVEFADAFFPMYENAEVDHNGDPFLSMQSLTRNTNMRATLAFAGEAVYHDASWSGPFTIKEARQHLGLLVLNGLSPSPSLDMKFDKNDVANYNHFATSNFGVNPVRRLKQFRLFFACQDPLKPTPNRAASPLFKVLPMISWIRKVGPLSWDCGIDVAIDEQTMGFQGVHVDKLRITYKKEGDGFQCDAICDDGFTYSVYFRNEPPPARYVRDGLSPLHARCIWLLDQLRDSYHRAWVDNLYMSAKLAKVAFNSTNKVLVAGVSRTKDRGIPTCVLQETVKKQELPTTRGAVKAAVLKGDPQCPDLIAVSVYDNKPVHFMSMVAESIQWIKKTRRAWNRDSNKVESMNFLCLNVNDDYNKKMNPVDIADQLRNVYRFDHWMRQRKWWWSIFLWSFGVLLTNSYIVYCRMMEMEKTKPLTHYEYLLSIARAWIDSDEEDMRDIRRRNAKKRKHDAQQHAPPPTTPASVSTRSHTSSSVSSCFSPKKAPRVSDHSLDPAKGLLRHRLNGFSFHCPETPSSLKPSCALHRWVLGRHVLSQKRGKIVCCSECKIHLCIACFHTFHTVKDLIKAKDDLKVKFEQERN